MIPSVAEIVRALYGCWCLAWNRPGAIDLFDRSTAGFVRSFYAAVLTLPAFLLSDLAHDSAGWASRGFLDWVSYGLRYTIYWLIFPTVAVVIAEKIGKLDRILDLLVPYNWVSLPLGYILAFFYSVGSGEGPMAEFTETIAVFVWIGVLVLLWRWARLLLGVSPLMAAGFVLADELSSTIAYLVLEAIAGAS